MPETRANQPSDPSSTRRGPDADDQITLSTLSPAPGQVVVVIEGEVDMLTSPQLRRTVLDQLNPANGTTLVVLELNGVTFLGTSGLAALIEAREAAHATGLELRLACTARRVLRPLTIAGLLPLFDIHDTLEKALRAT